MKNLCFASIAIGLLFMVACKSERKEKPESEKFFPALGFIRSQVAQVDTSLYPIRKVTFVDTVRTDTVFYKREQFRELASDFLMLPDIATPEYEDRFKEDEQYDESLNRVILTYLPVDPEKEEIQRQEVVIKPDPSGDKITSIIIDYVYTSKDSSIQKRLLWQVDRSFQVVTTRQLPGRDEVNETYKVLWNEDDDQ